MKRSNVVVAIGAMIAVVASLVAFSALEACNSGNGDCPEKVAVVPGASCSDEHLQCAFDLTTPAAACDGTSSVIETSCTCTKGNWSCPDAIQCDGGADAAEAGDEASTNEGGDDAGDSGDSADSGDSGDSAQPTDASDAG